MTRPNSKLTVFSLMIMFLFLSMSLLLLGGGGAPMAVVMVHSFVPAIPIPSPSKTTFHPPFPHHHHRQQHQHQQQHQQKTSSSSRLISSVRFSTHTKDADDPAATATATATTNNKTKKKSSKQQQRRQQRRRQKISTSTTVLDRDAIETWRLYGIATHPDDDDWIQKVKEQNINHKAQQQQVQQQQVQQQAPVPVALQAALVKRLKLRQEEIDEEHDDNSPLSSSVQVQLVRRSLDARTKLPHPTFVYVVDVTLTAAQAQHAKLKQQPGRTERLSISTSTSTSTTPTETMESQDDESSTPPPPLDQAHQGQKKRVLVVGAGPAGLFCALQLALSDNSIQPILLDRGQPVERRGRDIGALMHRTQLNENSNFAFGEGGAGTWSDGKLTTRIGRNSDSVRWILETLVQYGAPSQILWEGAPHLGTDNLVRLLRNMRHDLERLGGTILFGTKMTNLLMDPTDPRRVQGVQVEHEDGSTEVLTADATVLATGHSARDVYQTLHANGAMCLEPKGFAVGFRIEHPQSLITKIQYGQEWGPTVQTGRRMTDRINEDYFSQQQQQQQQEPPIALDCMNKSCSVSIPPHVGHLPVPSYRLATDKANDGTLTVKTTADGAQKEEPSLRGVYSFCMCPGGQIVPASTNSSELCVNGMSFSKRDSVWANSALVVAIQEDDPILEPYRQEFGVLAGLEFQRDMERTAAQMGGGNLTVPVQRVTDFLAGTISDTLPSSSYRLGVTSAPCHDIYPPPITHALRDALENYFAPQMPGYVHPEALLHAVETRTSSPLRMARNSTTMQAKGMSNLFPAGEGAGFAGGIVSAAVDGRAVAEAVLDELYGVERPGRLQAKSSGGKAVGFSY